MLVVAIGLVSLMVIPHIARGNQSNRSGEPVQPAVAAPININAASAAELEKLPGIGARMAARIVEYRQKNGPFKKVEELMNVRGVGEKNFLRLKGLITVGTAKGDRASSRAQ
jgi:comEA protein